MLKIGLLLLLNAAIVFSILFADSFSLKDQKSYIRPVFKIKDYKYWKQVEGSEFCTSNALSVSKLISEVTKVAATKTNVIYFTKTDILACKEYLPAIAEIVHDFGILIAMDLENNVDSSTYFSSNGNVNLAYFTDKFKDSGSMSEWISYFVFNNAMDRLTFEERKQIRATLRDIFPKSFIGYRFNPTFGPTPENTNPNRVEKQWQDFLPQDDDGDFIITTLPVQGFKRTLVFAENRDVLNDTCSGEFI